MMRNEIASIEVYFVEYLLPQMSSRLIFLKNQCDFDLKKKIKNSEKTLICRLRGIVVYNVVKPIVRILLAFFLVFILLNFVTIGNEFFITQRPLKHVWNKLFPWKLWTRLKIILKTLEITSNFGTNTVQFLIENSYSTIGNVLLLQTVGFAVEIDSTPFGTNPYL